MNAIPNEGLTLIYLFTFIEIQTKFQIFFEFSNFGKKK